MKRRLKTLTKSHITSKVGIQCFTPDITRGEFNKIESGPFGDKKIEKSHSSENVKGPLGFFHIQFVAKYQKMKEELLETFKNFRKVSHITDKNWKWGTLSPVL